MTAELLRDLARAKAVFQLRALCTVMGVHPRPLSHLLTEPGSILSDEKIEAKMNGGR